MRQPHRFLSSAAGRIAAVFLLGVGCTTQVPSTASWPAVQREAPAPPPDVDTAAPVAETHRPIEVRVTLDGAPIEGAMVTQGGTRAHVFTDTHGVAVVDLDLRLEVRGIVASHPEARTLGEEFWGEPPFDAGLDIALTRFDVSDNLDYVFQDPGTPDRDGTTDYCAHCHVTMVADWVQSAHEQAARNPVVHDLYAGAAAAWSDAAACEAAGGTWLTGIAPGTAAPGDRCYVGDGALPSLNPDCADTPCDDVATNTAGCADCHAPGIDGQLGGRDLLEATGIAYEHGVHCDVCHKIAAVDTDDPEPGVGGRIEIIRPTEDSPSPALGDWLPLTFGPYGDVANPRMGAVHNPLFGTADLCAGCHEHTQEAVVPGTTIDTSRWPDGRIPVQTTWSELRDGPLGLSVPCQSCHMPPDADVGNAADLGNAVDINEGISGGWYREAGSVRRHAWFGPRSAEQRMLDLAASLVVEKSVDGGVLDVSVTARNTGPGHAIPTGEPMRHMVLLVDATCGSTRLVATGGDAVPDFGGALAGKDTTGDWTWWPGARVGERIRVVARSGDWHDPPGTGPFGDGTFSPEDKGMPVEVVVGTVTITSVTGAGRVTTDAPLPSGDVAYRVDADDALPADGDSAGTWAGAAGFGFARVMVDADGQRNVPHFKAVDVVSDNRLPPQEQWTSHHTFASSCDDPTVRAQLVYRRFPVELARERGWDAVEQVMAEVVQ